MNRQLVFQWFRRNAGWLLLGAGAALMGVGLFRQEHLLSLQKAIRICLECIGIG
ncbi:MAG: hypothetical protein IJ662_09750 [Clostridia bacterium]|nr:hypothetical protein [Clostridia bacterium]